MSPDGRGARWSLAAGALLAALVAGLWLFGAGSGEGEVSPRSHDLRNYYYPLYEVTFGWLASGALPVWNPHHLCGLPWLASLQAGVFYPPHLLFVALPTHLALALSGLLHLILAALGAAALARRAGLSLAAAGAAGVLFAGRGTTQWWLLFPNALEAGAWLPLGCVAVFDLTGARPRRGACLLALATGMSLLAGYPQATAIAVYSWAALLLARVAVARLTPRRALAVVAGFGAALAIGVAVSAVQTLPTFALTLEGTRATAPLPEAKLWSVGLGSRWYLDRIAVGSHVSLGVLALALSPAALLVGRPRWLVLWALFVGAAAYALAVGSGSGLASFHRALPVLGWFRNPQRMLLLANFCAALVAALAVDAAARGPGRSGSRPSAKLRLAVAGLWPLALAAALLEHPVSAAIAAGAGLALLVGGFAPRFARTAGAALLVLACADAQTATSNRGRLPYRADAAAAYRDGADFQARLAGLQGDDRAVWLPQLVPVRDLKLAAHYGPRWLDDYEPLNLKRHAQYFDFLRYGRSQPPTRQIFSGSILPPDGLHPDTPLEPLLETAGRRRLLDLAAARWFVTRPHLEGLPRTRAFVEAAGLVAQPSPGARLALYENRAALPRAYVTYRTRRAPPPDALLRALSRADFDPLVESFVEGEPLPVSASPPPRGRPAHIAQDGARLVEVEAELDAPGLLVLADSFARGWRASADGRELPILATNHLFRGVALPAGRHRVSFEYSPPGLGAGAALTLLGATALAWLALAGRRTGEA